MIKCIRCHDDTTLDYIATGTIEEPVCLDCVTADEQDQLDAIKSGIAVPKQAV